MHRWVRGITVGVGGAALVVAAFGAGLSPAGAQDDPESDADAAVWNDQYATVDITNDGEASSGDNTASSYNGNVVLIGQGADADTEFLSESHDEILAWFTAEGFADWMGVEGSIDTGFSVIPGSPVVLPVLGGSATNLITSINNTAAGIAEITAGAAGVSNGTSATLAQTFSGGGADATSDATGGGADSHANASVNNTQGANVGVSNNGHASSGGNRATTANGNAVVIGQGRVGRHECIGQRQRLERWRRWHGHRRHGVQRGGLGHEHGPGPGEHLDRRRDREQQHERERHPVELRWWRHRELDGRGRRSAVDPLAAFAACNPRGRAPARPRVLHGKG